MKKGGERENIWLGCLAKLAALVSISFVSISSAFPSASSLPTNSDLSLLLPPLIKFSHPLSHIDLSSDRHVVQRPPTGIFMFLFLCFLYFNSTVCTLISIGGSGFSPDFMLLTFFSTFFTSASPFPTTHQLTSQFYVFFFLYPFLWCYLLSFLQACCVSSSFSLYFKRVQWILMKGVRLDGSCAWLIQVLVIPLKSLI